MVTVELILSIVWPELIILKFKYCAVIIFGVYNICSLGDGEYSSYSGK